MNLSVCLEISPLSQMPPRYKLGTLASLVALELVETIHEAQESVKSQLSPKSFCHTQQREVLEKRSLPGASCLHVLAQTHIRSPHYYL